MDTDTASNLNIDINKDWASKLAETLNHRIGFPVPSQNYKFYKYVLHGIAILSSH